MVKKFEKVYYRSLLDLDFEHKLAYGHKFDAVPTWNLNGNHSLFPCSTCEDDNNTDLPTVKLMKIMDYYSNEFITIDNGYYRYGLKRREEFKEKGSVQCYLCNSVYKKWGFFRKHFGKICKKKFQIDYNKNWKNL